MKVLVWMTLGCALVAACGDDDSNAADADVPGADAAPPDAPPPFEVSSISPDSAFYPGGRQISLVGVGLDRATAVSIDAVPCDELQVVSSTELACRVPPGEVGVVDVVVTGDDESATVTDGFTYLPFTRIDVIAGTGTDGFMDGTGDVAQFGSAVNSLVADGATLYVADGVNYRIRTIDLSGLDLSSISPADVTVATLAGNGTRGGDDSPGGGTGADAQFHQPEDLLMSGDGNLLVSDTEWETGDDSALRTTALSDGATTTLATLNGSSGIARDDTYLYVSVCDANGSLSRLNLGTLDLAYWLGDADSPGDQVGDASTVNFSCPYGLWMSPDQTTLYVADWVSNRIKQIDIATEVTTLLAGSGAAGQDDATDGALATFKAPGKIHGAAQHLFVADVDNCALRQIDLDTTAVTTLVGSAASCTETDGELATATLQYPNSVWYSPDYGIFVGSSDYGYRASQPGSTRIRLVH